MRYLFRAVLWVFLSATLLLSACLGGTPFDDYNSGSRTSVQEKKEPVKLRVAWWGGQLRHDYTLKVIELYMEKYPHVKIEPEYAGFDDYWKKLAPQAAANDLPDVIQMDISYLTQYGSKNQLEDLGPFTKDGTIRVEDISLNTLSGGQVSGRLLALSLGSNALQTTIDPVMLEEAGVELHEDWTFADWEEIGRRLKANGKLLTSDLRHDVFFPYYLRVSGQRMYAEDGTALGYVDDAPFVDFYTMYKRWYDEGYLLSLDKLAQKKGTPEDDELVLGNAVSTNGWSNQYILIAKTAGRPLELRPVPGWTRNKSLFLKPSMYFSIAKSSKHKEEAAKFIDFFLNDIEANKIINGERGVPVSAKVKEALLPDLLPEEKEVYEYVQWAEQNSGPMDSPNPVGAVEVDNLLKDIVEKILYNQLSVTEAAVKFREEANAILAKNK